MKATLFHPCFKGRLGQAYLPNNLLFLAGRLLAAGIEVDLLDEAVGHTSADIDQGTDFIGIGLMGPVYIPEVLRMIREIRLQGLRQPILIGGQTITRMTVEQFDLLFGQMGAVLRISCDTDLRNYLGPKLSYNFPQVADTVLGPALGLLSETMVQAYFSKEWCLYTSDGCAYNCNFCAASKGQKEQFLSGPAFGVNAEDLAQLTHKVVGQAPPYEIYLSTLDGFQSPESMEYRLKVAHGVMQVSGVKAPRFRCLATAKCVYLATQKDPELLQRWKSYGLSCVGIGVDGSEEAWKRENKKHNEQEQIDKSFERLLAAGIQPEALMVMALPNDSLRDIFTGALFCQRYASQGITVRPYLGKAIVPGSLQWTQNPHGIVDQLMSNPDLFRELDYSCMATRVSHHLPPQRVVANLVYGATCASLKLRKTGCPTTPILPTSSVPRPLRLIGRAWNKFVPGDR